MSPAFKNPAPDKSKRILLKLLKQKSTNHTIMGSGCTPESVTNMSIHSYSVKLLGIYNLLNKRLRALMQIIASGSVTVTSSEVKLLNMLTALNIKCYPQMLIQNHLVDLYIPKHGLVIEVNGSIHNRLFKMNQDLNKYEFLKQKYDIDTQSVLNDQVSSFANQLSLAIKTGNLKKLETYRSRKLERDICFDTISYWIQDKDLYKLLLMDLEKIQFRDELFASSILKPFKSPGIGVAA